MQKNIYFKIVIMITMFLFLIIAGGCGGGGGGGNKNPASPTLSNLKLSSGTLSPDFRPARTQYTANVANSVTSITITPTTTTANASILVNDVNVASGKASGVITLNVGSNTIVVIVENSAGSTSYTVTVIRASEPTYKAISADKALEMMTQSTGYIILDVRTSGEQGYKDKRMKNSILIPHTEIESRAAKDLPIKDQFIYVYCQRGFRSAIAAQTLVELGYTNVYDMQAVDKWPDPLTQ